MKRTRSSPLRGTPHVVFRLWSFDLGARGDGSAPDLAYSTANAPTSEGVTILRAPGCPYSCDAETWQVVRPFVDGILAQCAANPKTARRAGIENLVARYAVWAHRERGYPLDVEMFRFEAINHYIATELPTHTEKTRASYRSLLYAVARTVLPARFVEPPREKLGNHSLAAPYTPEEVLDFHAWATGQPTAHRRRNAGVILALGFGAGLRLREMNLIRLRDVTIYGDGAVIIRVPDDGRTVPVKADWESLIDEAAGALGDDEFLFRPGRIASEKQLREATSMFLRTTKMPERAPNPYRMRNTWLVDHLKGRVPFDVLVRAAGLKEAKSLCHLAEYVDEAEFADVQRMLRAAHAEREQAMRALRGGRA